MALTTVTDYLERTASQFPEKVAFADATREMTFGELRAEARRVASTLLRLGLHHRPVAVFLDKSAVCIAAFLGALYSGNFYTPLDTAMPESRIQKILTTLQPAVIVTDEAHEGAARAFAGEAQVLTYETMMQTAADEAAVDAAAQQVIDTDVCYVLFTSGTTGVPKGVIVPHRGVIAYTEWVHDTFAFSADTIIGNQTPLYFSMSVQDIFQTLRNGCTTYFIPREYFTFPIKLLDYLNQKHINSIYWVPSALCLVANLKALRRKEMPYLKQILFAGEAMPAKQLNMWRKAVPQAAYHNLFGPTEVTDICTYYTVQREISDNESIPIGVPCQNAGILLLNNDDKEVLQGEQGELCVRGSFLAFGYYNNPIKTQTAFVQNPLNTAYPETIYRTGDLVHYNEQGELMYDGRKDFQIKHMGYRIELGEIETAAGSLAGVDANACIYDAERDRIHIFYAGRADEATLKDGLAQLVPHYMMPGGIHHLAAMPLNLNGKIDRTALKEQVKKA